MAAISGYGKIVRLRKKSDGVEFSVGYSEDDLQKGLLKGSYAIMYIDGKQMAKVNSANIISSWASAYEIKYRIESDKAGVVYYTQPAQITEPITQETGGDYTGIGQSTKYPLNVSRGQYSFKVNNELQEKAIKEFLGIEPQGVDLDTYLSNLDEQGLKFWADYWHNRFYEVGLTGSAFSFTTAKYNEYLAILRNSAQHQAEDGILKLYFKNKISGTEYNKLQSNLTKITGVVSRFLPAPVKIKKAVVNTQENSVDIYVSDTAFIISTSVLILIMASLTFMGFLVHKITYLLKGNQEAHYEASKETLYKDLTNSGLSPEQALKVMNSIYGEEFGGEDNKTSIGEVVSDISMLLPVVIIFMLLSSLKK